jgi:hypothetical protein
VPHYQQGDRLTLKQSDEALIVTGQRRSLMSSCPSTGAR